MFEVQHVSEDYRKNRSIRGDYHRDPALLFDGITGLVLFLTPYCNFTCQHCCVDYKSFLDGASYPIMTRGAALCLVEMLPYAQQYTDSGGEVFLLDSRARDSAVSAGMLQNRLAARFSGFNYLPELVERQIERLRADWQTISERYPTNGQERFVRILTNGLLIASADGDAHSRHALDQSLRDYRGTLLQLSVGPFQEIQYQRAADRNPGAQTLAGVADELVEAAIRLSPDNSDHSRKGCDPKSVLNRISVGFMFTHLSPRLKKIRDEDWDALDYEVYLLNRDIPLEQFPSQKPSRNKSLAYLKDRYSQMCQIEEEQIVDRAKGNDLPWAIPVLNTDSNKPLSETSELYAVPGDDGDTVYIFSSKYDMYCRNRDKAHIILRHHDD